MSELGVRHGLVKTGAALRRESESLAEFMKIRFYPFVLERGEGCYLTDVDGNRYLDLCAGAGVMNIGYQNARVRAAIESEGAAAWSTTSAGLAHPRQTELAERLNTLVPGDTKVWFGNSGSEAMDMLSRYARLASGRPRLVSFGGSDHGQTAASAAISGLGFHANAAAEYVTKVPYPYPYRSRTGPARPMAARSAALASSRRSCARGATRRRRSSSSPC